MSNKHCLSNPQSVDVMLLLIQEGVAPSSFLGTPPKHRQHEHDWCERPWLTSYGDLVRPGLTPVCHPGAYYCMVETGEFWDDDLPDNEEPIIIQPADLDYEYALAHTWF